MAAIVVHIDLQGDRPHPSSAIALAAGRHVASSWGATLYACIIVHDPDEREEVTTIASADHIPGVDAITASLARAGADKIAVALTAATITPLWASVGGAWQAVLDHLRPRLVLFGADAPSAPELAARTGARIGARLLSRARAVGIDDVELRDRDGGYARAPDSGAAVALIGRADPVSTGEDDVDWFVIAVPGRADERVELAGTAMPETQHVAGAIVAVGDDALSPAALADAQRIAARLDARLVGSAAAVRAGALPAGAIVDAKAGLVPEICVVVGTPPFEIAGATHVVKIGAKASKGVAGALTGAIEPAMHELAKELDKL